MAEGCSPKDESGSSKDWRDRLAMLTPEQLQQVRSYAWDRLLRARKVNVDGKQMSLRALADEVKRQKTEFEKGTYDEDVRTVPRAEAQQRVPSRYMRPGSEKQVLRREEEDSLELQRMGIGNFFTTRRVFGFPTPGKERNFGYAIFARPDRVESFLGNEWAGKKPEAVLEDSRFYLDILRRCHQLEMTLMMLTSRPLPLSDARPAVEDALRNSMERLGGGQPLEAQDSDALSNFVKLFDDKRLASTGWVENGAVQKGTHIIVSATPQAGLTAEAITPGPIAKRKTSFIGTAQNPLLTAAVFDVFLGQNPLDIDAKRDVGTGVLWAANGLSFSPGKLGKHYVGTVGEDGKMELGEGTVVQRLPATTSIFRLVPAHGEAPAPMLVNKIALGS